MTDILTEFKETNIRKCIGSFLVYATGSLTRKEQEVLSLRLGLDCHDYREIKTLQQIGESLGISGERVRQIEAKAARKVIYKFNEYVRRRIKYNITKQQKVKI